MDRNRASGAQRLPDWDASENWTSPEELPDFLERIGIETSRFAHQGQRAFSVIDPYGKSYDLATERPLFYIIKRGATPGGLESALQSQAQEMGIPIEYNTPCAPGQADIWAGGTFGQGSLVLSTGITFKTDHPDQVCVIVDPSIAPRAYAYLVTIQGEGTLAVVLTEARKEANAYLERAIDVFKRSTGIEIREPHKSGGSGGDMAAFRHGRNDFVIGEAGGYQDFLWGFGIRHAFATGYLAAQAILNGQDWQAVADEHVRPLVMASMVNRWLYDRVPTRGYAMLVRRFASSPDLNALIGRWYHPRKIHRLLWPVVSRDFERKAADASEHTYYSHRTRRATQPGS